MGKLDGSRSTSSSRVHHVAPPTRVAPVTMRRTSGHLRATSPQRTPLPLRCDWLPGSKFNFSAFIKTRLRFVLKKLILCRCCRWGRACTSLIVEARRAPLWFSNTSKTKTKRSLLTGRPEKEKWLVTEYPFYSELLSYIYVLIFL